MDHPLEDSVEKGKPTHGLRMKLAMWIVSQWMILWRMASRRL
jgi:hypothetical protein